MKGKYKGYVISTSWSGKTMGFGFSVHSEDGTESSRSEALYFYEENALKAAKEAVDEKTGPGENADGHNGKAGRESRLRGSLAEWMMAHGAVRYDSGRSREYAGVRIARVCWRGRDYCITWVDGEACWIEKE